MSSYIIDTNSILDYPEILLNKRYQFITPSSVIAELDRLKRDRRVSETARPASRIMLKALEEGAVQIVDFGQSEYADDDIYTLACEKLLPVITGDINLTIRLKSIVSVWTVDEMILSCIRDRKTYDHEDLTYGFFRQNGQIGYRNNTTFRAYGDRDLKLHSHINVSHANLPQAFLIGGMLDSEIKLLTVTGLAGSGKTFVSLAAALYLVEMGAYNQILWAVPPEHIDGVDKYGFLPGNLYEKMRVYFGGLLDNCEKLGYDIEVLEERGILEELPFTLLRGKSIANKIVILDEAQNASKSAMKALLTRVEDSSKVVLIGDLEQSDRYRPCLSGLYSIIETFDNKVPFAGSIEMNKNRRGLLSSASAELL